MGETTVLRGGRVIDPAQGINKITDVQMRDGKIAAVGDVADTPDAKVIDVSGQVVTPGWIDLHIHAYGDLGFAFFGTSASAPLTAGAIALMKSRFGVFSVNEIRDILYGRAMDRGLAGKDNIYGHGRLDVIGQ